MGDLRTMMKEISREEIIKEDPDWPHGNVMMKSGSFGENSLLAGMLAVIKSKAGPNGKKDFETDVKDNISIEEINVTTLAICLNWVKNRDGTDFILKPGSMLEIRKKFVYDLDFKTGQYLVSRTEEVNKLPEDLEKKSGSSS